METAPCSLCAHRAQEVLSGRVWDFSGLSWPFLATIIMVKFRLGLFFPHRAGGALWLAQGPGEAAAVHALAAAPLVPCALALPPRRLLHPRPHHRRRPGRQPGAAGGAARMCAHIRPGMQAYVHVRAARLGVCGFLCTGRSCACGHMHADTGLACACAARSRIPNVLVCSS
jgi:hypothetical protein